MGNLRNTKSLNNLRDHLIKQGYEQVHLAWRDTGEILSMRKVDGEIFQYHIRLFSDGEIRGHYEYSPEGSPIKHVKRTCFEKRVHYFNKLLNEFFH